MAMDENPRYAKSLYWYSGKNVPRDLDRNRLKINAYSAYADSWRKISIVIPDGECVSSVDPTWFMLYADRPAYAVPEASSREDYLARGNRCRYVYMASYARRPYPVFYPQEYLGDVRTISVDRMEAADGAPILGLLVEVPRVGTSTK